jgi:hypothetical protein
MVQFLRCISKLRLRQADIAYIVNFLKKDENWERLLLLAEKEGVAGLLYHHVKNLDLVCHLPQSVARRLENIYRGITNNTLGIIMEVRALSARLAQTWIPVLVLQGVSIIKLYRDPGLRPLGDIDLMVEPQHKERLKELLKESGYKALYPTYPDILCKTNVLIDIHTHILNLERIQSRRYLFPEDLAPMWERAVPFSDGSDGLLRLDPYDNFIALGAHTLKHSYSRLIWLADLHESLMKLTIRPGGWEKLVEYARFWRQEKVILYSLLIIEGVFSIKYPGWVKSEFGINRLRILEKYVIRLKLKGLPTEDICDSLCLFAIKEFRHKIRFLKETLFPKAEIMAQIFPHELSKGRGFVIAKRTAQAIHLFWLNLRHALRASFTPKK